MQLVTYQRREPRDAADAPASEHSMRDVGLGFETLEETTPGTRRLGALIALGDHAGSIVDLNRALAVKLASEDAGAPEAEADSLLPHDALLFLGEGRRALGAARGAFAFATEALERYDAPDLIRAGVVEPRRRVRLCAPIPRPGKIVGVVCNYAAAAEESGVPLPQEPRFFLEAPSAVIGPDDEILLPAASARVDFEGQLGVVIGRRASGVTAEEALDHVAGYCAANDVTARDIQDGSAIGKSFDTFTPLGPVLVTTDEIPDPQALAIRTSLSGEPMQSATTKEMLFPVADLIARASHLMTLEPGDVVITGTPGGVGATREPARYLQDGDIVEVAIEGIGRLHNYVRRP